MKRKCLILFNIIFCMVAMNFLYAMIMPDISRSATSVDYAATPPFVGAGAPPLVMLVMGRDHKLYYEAYNDASDLNGDGKLDVGYNPEIEYYGYFDSYKNYTYNNAEGRFEPSSLAPDKTTSASNEWSGDFLNYLTMTRMDCLRKVLYGGYRSTDSPTETVLERVFVPQDAHSWGKEYRSIAHDGYDIRDYTPLNLPAGASRHLFANTTLSNTGDPLLRVLENSVYRIWEWVAIERPVAGDKAIDGGTGPDVTDNTYRISPGEFVDVTDGGDAGTIADSYTSGDSALFEDDFNDSTVDPSWRWADHDAHVGTQYLQDGGELTISANGADVWNNIDEFAALYREAVPGDFDARVRIISQQNTHAWAKAGIMVRNDMTQPGTSTGYSMISVTPVNGFSFQWDSNNNGYLNQNNSTGGAASPPDAWVRLTRVGNIFTGYYSTDGVSWIQVSSQTINSANLAQDVGLFVTSHNSGTLCEVVFDDFWLEIGALDTIPENAFDDNLYTEWWYPEEPEYGNYPWIEFGFHEPIEIKAYNITGGNVAPESWKLMGSTDQSEWETLDTVISGGLIPGDTKTFTCENSGTYKYYRLMITNTTDSSIDGFSIKEIEMMETTEPTPGEADLTDYAVRVLVGDDTVGVEPNSKLYPSGVYKPIGLLQRHGESNRMYFGLLTGSYTKNTSGGVLRKNIGPITDEIDPDTGQYLYKSDSSIGGIIKTIDSLRTVGFDYNSYSYNQNCGWITNRPINEGECRMWGNPIAEMMYETLRYFSGAGGPTSEFTYGTGSSLDDNILDLPLPSWQDPYDPEDGYDYCSKPFMLVLSDINPSYDSDRLPGSAFGSVSSTLSGLNVETLAQNISAEEGEFGDHYIGESGSIYDGTCSPKTVSGLGDIRGLCPEEPTKQGSYYAASVAFHGNTVDISPHTTGIQRVETYAVGLASPLPRIEIPVGDHTVTMVPFGKTIVAGSSISRDKGEFQPTCTIVDFFIEQFANTAPDGSDADPNINDGRPYVRFRINFEDVEQGADHDMDAIIIYELIANDDDTLTVTTVMEYEAAGYTMNFGYIISGTEDDGSYLEISSKTSNPEYFLNTPDGYSPGDCDPPSSSECSNLPQSSIRTFTPSGEPAATLLRNPLWYAAKYGGFDDYDQSGFPDQQHKWDKSGDGNPDNYFYVQNPLELEKQLNQSFIAILAETFSGTAASVVSQTRSGEGAVYQAVFYPEHKDSTITWAGDVRALLVDSYGRMREDTNQNRKLDEDEDLIVVFGDTLVERYDGPELVDTVEMDDIKFLWSASDWLNSLEDAEAVVQRVNYTDTTKNRYIFTFADENENMVVDSGEQVPFEYPASSPDLMDASDFFPYLNLFPTFGDEPDIIVDGVGIPLNTFRSETDAFAHFLHTQSERLVNYIRGADQQEYTSSTTPSYTLPAFRNRQYDDDGEIKTWRLGDIVFSTPTVVGRPAEGYHRRYRDSSYASYALENQNRRTVIYAGGNDGMLHAFNGGFYDSNTKGFELSINGETEFELGAELWAYIPYNLLPHLTWLTEPEYPHVYYVDLKPKVFDAKIRPNGSGEATWGTYLVGGMRLGGGEIIADMDKTDGNTYNPNIDRTMRSAYFLIDITDPESPPDVIAEFSFDGLGYTTSYPAVIPMKDKGDHTINEWYLVFGSGPAEADGSPGTGDSLHEFVSSQKGKIFVVDLKKLVMEKTLKVLDNTGSWKTPDGTDHYQSLDDNSFISDSITVDYNLSYKADAVYFGTVQGNSSSGWGGKLRRIVINNEPNPSLWDGDSTLIDLTSVGQPITAAPNAGIDDKKKRWVYFGTGRYLVDQDKVNYDQQSYYGIIEPFDNENQPTWLEVDGSDLLDVTDALVNSNLTVQNVDGVGAWGELINKIDDDATAGWFLDFPSQPTMILDAAGERNIGQAALFGEMLIFTTYIPSSDVCTVAGESNLYALYYKTGTAYFRDIIGATDTEVEGVQSIDKMSYIGTGLALTPTLHVGRGDAPTIYVPTSRGPIHTIETPDGSFPGASTIKSGIRSWREKEEYLLEENND